MAVVLVVPRTLVWRWDPTCLPLIWRTMDHPAAPTVAVVEGEVVVRASRVTAPSRHGANPTAGTGKCLTLGPRWTLP